MLIGAGVGALGSALKGDNLLKGAALGGALGGVGGGMESLLKGGSFLQGAGLSGLGGASSGISGATATGSGLTGTGINLAPAVIGDTSLAIAPQAINTGGMFAANSLPTAAGELGASGVGGIGNLAQYATGAGTDLMAASPSLIDKLKPYANVQNLSGAMNIADRFKPKPPQFISAPTGGVSKGQAPQSNGLILSMDELMKLSQLQRSQPISLLVG
jgi:hypothetical protein